MAGQPDSFEEDRRKKTIAYLIDKQTIRILDLVSGIPLGTVHHQGRVQPSPRRTPPPPPQKGKKGM